MGILPKLQLICECRNFCCFEANFIQKITSLIMMEASQRPLADYQRPTQCYFSPYEMNGGTILAIAGDDYALIATDTRLSQGFSIHSRDCPKTFHLSDQVILGSCGFHGDVLTLTKTIGARLKVFAQDHNKEMSTKSVAAMLSTILYYKRFFPYYTHNVVAGLDEEGKGAIYSFDPVGSYEREGYRAKGSSASILQSFLDNQIGEKNLKEKNLDGLTKEKC